MMQARGMFLFAYFVRSRSVSKNSAVYGFLHKIRRHSVRTEYDTAVRPSAVVALSALSRLYCWVGSPDLADATRLSISGSLYSRGPAPV